MPEKGINQGHRQRMRTRFLKEGLVHFEAHNVLEMLLFYSIPQRDTNRMAHRLLERFGSLDAVLKAPVDELAQVSGVGAYSAMLLSAVGQAAGCYLEDRSGEHDVIGSEKLVRFGIRLSRERKRRETLLICADNRRRLLTYHVITEGELPDDALDWRGIAGLVLGGNVTRTVVVFSRPDGREELSLKERRVLRQLVLRLNRIGVKVEDCLTVCPSQRVFRASKVPNCRYLLEAI